MCRLFNLGKFGRVYIVTYAHNGKDGKAPFDLWRSAGEWFFEWKMLYVIVTPPSAIRGPEP